MKTIGLIAAMQQEIRPLLKRVGKSEAVRVDTFQAFRFRIAGSNCLLVCCGVGKEKAAEAARVLIASGKPDLLVSFGIAGGVGSDLRIGDIVTGEKACLLDAGVPGKVLPLAVLSAADRNGIASALLPNGAALVSGTILTTPGPQPLPEKTNVFSHPVVEMETFGIAEIANTLGIPLFSLRSISDNPDAPIPFPVEAMYDAQYRLRIGWILWSILRRPALISQLARLTRNSDLAAENGACAVLALLNQISID